MWNCTSRTAYPERGPTTPFELRDEINVNDDLRLRYRYLDLRRPSMHEPIVVRSKIMQIIRNYFCENHFTEIETPRPSSSPRPRARAITWCPAACIPAPSTPCPQSPQLYKQILMLSGFDRYMQIARCFRDEDLRADRQPEFLQVDEEMSFVSEDDIMTINEGLIKRLWKEMLEHDVQTPSTVCRGTRPWAASAPTSPTPASGWRFRM